jgi:hypothetical protein
METKIVLSERQSTIIVAPSGEDYITRSFILCTLHLILFGVMKSRRLKWAGHVACIRERRGAYRVLVGKPEGKKLLGKSTRR